ncbi:hypothetical protein B0H11DRAFT_2385511 [Mycena galericulata]|nr:hypothetical protein B0H11DRAFT_2385511 [Mycena galericulata]
MDLASALDDFLVSSQASASGSASPTADAEATQCLSNVTMPIFSPNFTRLEIDVEGMDDAFLPSVEHYTPSNAVRVVGVVNINGVTIVGVEVEAEDSTDNRTTPAGVVEVVEAVVGRDNRHRPRDSRSPPTRPRRLSPSPSSRSRSRSPLPRRNARRRSPSPPRRRSVSPPRRRKRSPSALRSPPPRRRSPSPSLGRRAGKGKACEPESQQEQRAQNGSRRRGAEDQGPGRGGTPEKSYFAHASPFPPQPIQTRLESLLQSGLSCFLAHKRVLFAPSLLKKEVAITAIESPLPYELRPDALEQDTPTAESTAGDLAIDRSTLDQPRLIMVRRPTAVSRFSVLQLLSFRISLPPSMPRDSDDTAYPYTAGGWTPSGKLAEATVCGRRGGSRRAYHEGDNTVLISGEFSLPHAILQLDLVKNLLANVSGRSFSPRSLASKPFVLTPAPVHLAHAPIRAPANPRSRFFATRPLVPTPHPRLQTSSTSVHLAHVRTCARPAFLGLKPAATHAHAGHTL